MPPKFGGAPKCDRCGKSVYKAEESLHDGKVSWEPTTPFHCQRRENMQTRPLKIKYTYVFMYSVDVHKTNSFQRLKNRSITMCAWFRKRRMTAESTTRVNSVHTIMSMRQNILNKQHLRSIQVIFVPVVDGSSWKFRIAFSHPRKQSIES